MKSMCKSFWLLGAACLVIALQLTGQAPSDDEKGMQLVDQYCASCHEPTGWMHSKDEWEVIVPDHAARGGASPSAAETELMISYLTRHFGTERASSPSDDREGKKLYEKACGPCHAYAGWVHTKEEWESIAPDMAYRSGESFTDEELRILVSYLTKHSGAQE